MVHVPAFPPDFAGAIVLPAAQYGYGGKPGTFNHARTIGLHTPEEPADDVASTPTYFHNLYNRFSSTTYFVAARLHYNAVTGEFTRIFQMVPERAGAYGNAVDGKPYPDWADPNVNLNLQTYSIEIEGYAHNIHLTMPRGSDQWKALAGLMADIARRRSRIRLEWTFPHSLVSIYRTDPGQLDIDALVADALAIPNWQAEEEDMTKDELIEALRTVRIPELQDRSLVDFMQDSDDYIIDMIRQVVKDEVLGLSDKLNTIPTLALSDDDLKKLAKYVNDDHAERMKS